MNRLFVFFIGFALAASPAMKLSGEIRGLKGQGNVLIGIFDEPTWGTKKPVKGIRISADRVTEGVATFSVILPAGEYGVTAIEDLNKNDRLDFILFLPAEPAGFSRDYQPVGPPDFNEFKFKLDKPNDIRIRVK